MTSQIHRVLAIVTLTSVLVVALVACSGSVDHVREPDGEEPAIASASTSETDAQVEGRPDSIPEETADPIATADDAQVPDTPPMTHEPEAMQLDEHVDVAQGPDYANVAVPDPEEANPQIHPVTPSLETQTTTCNCVPVETTFSAAASIVRAPLVSFGSSNLDARVVRNTDSVYILTETRVEVRDALTLRYEDGLGEDLRLSVKSGSLDVLASIDRLSVICRHTGALQGFTQLTRELTSGKVQATSLGPWQPDAVWMLPEPELVLRLESGALRMLNTASGLVEWQDEARVATVAQERDYVAYVDGDHVLHVKERKGTTFTAIGVIDLDGSPNVLALSDDGSLVAAADGHIATIYRVSTGEELAVFAWNPDRITAMAFSPGASSVAIGCTDGAVRVWNMDDDTALLSATLLGRIQALGWTDRKQERLVAVSKSQIVSLDPASQTGTASIPWLMPDAIEFLADGLLAIATKVGYSDVREIQLWDLESRIPVRRIELGDVYVLGLYEVGNGLLLAELRSGELLLIDVNGDVALYAEAVTGTQVSGLSVAGRGNCRLAYVSGGAAYVLDLDEDHEWKVPSNGREVTSVGISHDGKSVACGVEDGTVEIWNTETRELTSTVSTDFDDKVDALYFSPDSRLLAAAASGYQYGSGQAGVWDLASQMKAFSIPFAYHIAWNTDGSLLLVGGDVYEVRSAKCLQALRSVDDAAFSRDGQLLAIAGNGQIHILSLKSVLRSDLASIDVYVDRDRLLEPFLENHGFSEREYDSAWRDLRQDLTALDRELEQGRIDSAAYEAATKPIYEHAGVINAERSLARLETLLGAFKAPPLTVAEALTAAAEEVSECLSEVNTFRTGCKDCPVSEQLTRRFTAAIAAAVVAESMVLQEAEATLQEGSSLVVHWTDQLAYLLWNSEGYYSDAVADVMGSW